MRSCANLFDYSLDSHWIDFLQNSFDLCADVTALELECEEAVPGNINQILIALCTSQQEKWKCSGVLPSHPLQRKRLHNRPFLDLHDVKLVLVS